MKRIPALTLAALASTSLAFASTLPVPPATKIKVKALSKNLGSTVVMNESYILAGSPTSLNGSLANSGDAQVYRVSDGSFVRRFVSPFPAFNGNFGKGLAIYGGIAYIGAEGDAPSPSFPESGAVYAFDIATGKLLWLALGEAGQNIGFSLSVSGDLMVAGGPNGELSMQPAASGSVAVIDRKDGFVINSYRLPSPAFADRFGYSVALDGRRLAAGAPYRDTAVGGTDSGTVACFDAVFGGAMTFIDGENPVANARFGWALAASRRKLAIGAPQWGSLGRVELWTTDGQTLLYRPFIIGMRQMGRCLAIAGNTLLVGGTSDFGSTTSEGGVACLVDLTMIAMDSVEVAPHTAAEAVNFGVAVAMTEQAMIIADDQQPIPGSISKGALWLVKQTPQNITPSVRYGTTNDLAPGLTGVRYASFADPTVTELGGSIMFRAGLKGAGVTTSNNSAVFNNRYSASGPALIVRRGQKEDGKTVTALSSMFFDVSNFSQPLLKTTTGGLTTVFRDDSANLLGEVRVNAVPGNQTTAATIAAITALTSGGEANAAVSFVYTAKLGAGVTAANDSRVARHIRDAEQHADFRKEGDTFDMSAKYGQISPRLAGSFSNVVFHTALTGSTATNTAVVIATAAGTSVVARKGDGAPGATGDFTSFLGEGVNIGGIPIIRATTSTGLEGLWYKTSNDLVAYKGQPAPGTPSGVKFNRFTRFFISDANSVLFTATLTGTGITTANDQGVWLMKGGTITLLMREGDAAPDCAGARIGSISALDFGPLTGRYALLVTLTGSTSSTNQALYYGDSTMATAQAILPRLTLRKGSYVNRAGGTRIASLSVGIHNIDSSGSGSKGSVRLVSDKGALVKVTYSDAQQELMSIKP